MRSAMNNDDKITINWGTLLKICSSYNDKMLTDKQITQELEKESDTN